MAHSDAVGDSVALPNYAGELFIIGNQFQVTPLLTMAGGMTGGPLALTDIFPLGNFLTLDAAAQNTVTETASITAPASDIYTAAQLTNFIEIHQRRFAITYKNQAMTGAISGTAVVGMGVTRPGDPQTQRMAFLAQLAIDLNFVMHHGTGTTPATAATNAKTRGIVTAVNADGSNELDAAGAAFSESLMNQLEVLILAQVGSMGLPVIFAGAYIKQRIGEEYGYAPESFTVGGVTLEAINLPTLGRVGIAYDPGITASTMGLYDMSKVSPVFMVTPGKPAVFFEPLGTTGASVDEQLFTMFGVDYGSPKYHGTIIDLATS